MSNKLTKSCVFTVPQSGRDEWIRCTDDSNASTPQILLTLDALVHREEDVKSACFGRCQQVTVFQSGQSSIAGCLAIMTGEGVPESLIDAFIDQDSHLRTCEQKVFGLFESSYGCFTRDGRV